MFPIMQANPRRSAFLKMLSRPRVNADFSSDDARQGRFSFLSEGGERVPGIFVRPAVTQGKAPVVIALHGTNGNKEQMLPLMGQLAQRGWLALAMDGRHHGARASHRGAYQEAILRKWRTGEGLPFLYDTVWDVHRLLDIMPRFGDIDVSRIGLVGISKGGMEGYLAAASDERIKASVPCIAAQSFRWGIENDAWQARVSTFQSAFDAAARDEGISNPGAEFLRRFYDKVAPGIYSEFDGPAMLPLIAPRPLYLINGETDPRTPLPGLQECIKAAQTAYKSTPGRFGFLIQPDTGHQVRPESLAGAVEWLAHFL